MTPVDSKPSRAARPVRPASESEGDRRARNRQLILMGALASLVLSGLLTMDLLPTGPVGLGGRLPRPGEIADRSYKAPSDINIVDQHATEEARRAALDQAPVIYDFDERQASVLRENIVAAFVAARSAASQSSPDATSSSIRDVFLDALLEGTQLPDAGFELLERRGFDGGIQSALIRLIEPVVVQKIVDDASEIEAHRADRNVLIRALGSGAKEPLKAPEAIKTLAAARELVGTRPLATSIDLSAEDQEAIRGIATALIRPNLAFNLRATDEERKAAESGVKEVTIALRKGEIVVRDGVRITDHQVMILEGLWRQANTASRVTNFLGIAALLMVLIGVIWRFASTGIQRFPTTQKDAVFLLSTLVVTGVGTRLSLFVCDAVADYPDVAPLLENSPRPLYFIIPVAAATMLVRMVHSAETAALFAVMVSLLTGLQVQGDVPFAFYAVVGSFAAAFGAARVSQRGTLLRAGVSVGLANIAVILSLNLIGGEVKPIPMAISMALGFVSGVMSGALVLSTAPMVEWLFGYTTDVKLLELANREQVLLRELELRAPGTYHHSMMVGHLAEKAAEAIGANALLAKVGGYYHDIGKMRRPHFFVENVTIHQGENRHEKLSPSMSARIIQAHVKDGLELGDKYNLVFPIMRAIGEHHGTSIIRFFFEKAKEIADPEKGEIIEEHDYRYPGPKPQTRESGILMLADSVEAASRTLSDTSPARIQQLVQRIINNYFRDGQLDECSLTLRDLHLIARSFIDTLSAIRHERIDYPDATDAEGRKFEENADEGVVERLEPRQKDRPDRNQDQRRDDIKRLGIPRR